MKKRAVDSRLNGEVTKAVWSMTWNYKEIKIMNIKSRLQYPSGFIANAIKELVAIGAVTVEDRTLKVSENVVDV